MRPAFCRKPLRLCPVRSRAILEGRLGFRQLWVGDFVKVAAHGGPMSETRKKIAAILVSDVVGYSAGSPARTKIVRWRGLGRSVAI